MTYLAALIAIICAVQIVRRLRSPRLTDGVPTEPPLMLDVAFWFYVIVLWIAGVSLVVAEWVG